MPADSTASGACTSGSTVPRKDARRRTWASGAPGGAATTNTVRAEDEASGIAWNVVGRDKMSIADTVPDIPIATDPAPLTTTQRAVSAPAAPLRLLAVCGAVFLTSAAATVYTCS